MNRTAATQFTLLVLVLINMLQLTYSLTKYKSFKAMATDQTHNASLFKGFHEKDNFLQECKDVYPGYICDPNNLLNEKDSKCTIFLSDFYHQLWVEK